MNILLWLMQILLALHTAAGAVWKFSHSAQHTMPSLAAIPNSLWLTMSGIELLCSLCLILPMLYKPLAILIPVAAVCIALEMLMLSAVHLNAVGSSYSPLIYWLVVAAVCAFIAYGRAVLQPL